MFPRTITAYEGRNVFCRDEADIKVVAEMESDVYRLNSHRLSGLPIIDCGANIGAFSLFARWKSPKARIVALEPDRDNFSILEKNVEGTSIEIANRAVMGHHGEVAMEPSSNTACKAHYLLPPSPIEEWMLDVSLVNSLPPTWSKAEAITLPEVFSIYGLDEVDVCKMDIECSEYGVIENTPSDVLKKIRYLALELHAHTPTVFGKLLAKMTLTHHVETLGSYMFSAYAWCRRYNL